MSLLPLAGSAILILVIIVSVYHFSKNHKGSKVSTDNAIVTNGDFDELKNKESNYPSITTVYTAVNSTTCAIKNDIQTNDTTKENTETTTVSENKIKIGFVVTERDPLNVREDSNKNAKVIGTIPKGGEVSIISDSGEWYAIDYFGKIGYVSKSYISFDKEDIPKEDSSNNVKKQQGRVNTEKDPLNIRKEPSASSKIIGTVPKDSTVSITDESGDWYIIEYKGGIGYVAKEYILIVD